MTTPKSQAESTTAACHICGGLKLLPNWMDAPGHPRCACGRDSIHESGQCGVDHGPIFCPRCGRQDKIDVAPLVTVEVTGTEDPGAAAKLKVNGFGVASWPAWTEVNNTSATGAEYAEECARVLRKALGKHA